MEDNSNIISTNILNRINDIFEIKSFKNKKKIKKYKSIKNSKRIRIKDDIKKNKDNEANNLSTNKFEVKNINNKKERNPGVDLVRLIAMYGTVINHTIYMYGAESKYRQYSKSLRLFHILTGWHNNGFALLSGVVGYKTNKYANLLYLWLFVTFYNVGIRLYFIKFRKYADINIDLSKYFYPLMFRRYWYFTAYFGMYLFLPAVNKGISILKKYELLLIVISTNFLFVFWRDLKNPNEDVFQMASGGSVLWLFSFYFTGAYIGKYNVIYSGFKRYIFCFICIFIYLSSSYAFYKKFYNELYLGNGYYQRKIVSILNQFLTDKFDGLFKITNSIVVTLFFMQIHYNKYIAKFISFFGQLAFSVYIIHGNPYVYNIILAHSFEKEPYNLSRNSVLIKVALCGLKILVSCLFIDVFRHLLFSFLRIRKICIFLENIMNKILSKLIN